METRPRNRIVLADDHKLLAQACKSLLEPEFEVVGLAYSGYELLDQAIRLKPNGAIVDIAMPRLNGLDAGEQLKKLMPEVRLVFMTGSTSPGLAADAFRIGASGYVVKSAGSEELLTALRKAFAGQAYVSPAIAGNLINFMLEHKHEVPWNQRLTFRQRSIFQLLVEGLSMKEAAEVLRLSVGAISFHKYNIMKILGVETNAELVRIAVKTGIV
jgi:DNA-binding NarL/FixJ family response regulator